MRIRSLLTPLLSPERDGFALPAVLFTMVVMTIMAVAAIDGSVDQQRSSAAVRRSGESFYAAESGLYAVVAAWNDTASTLDSTAKALSSGGTLDLGWDTLPSGASYHAQVIRLNDGGDDMFLLSVRGRDAGAAAGGRDVSMLVTSAAGKLALGACCEGAAMVRAGVDVNSQTGITGTDTNPPLWTGGQCDGHVPNDRPGLFIEPGMGVDSLDISSTGFVRSGDSITNNENYRPVPAVVVDSTISDATFNLYGTKTWQEVRDMATTTIGNGPGGGNLNLHWGGDPATDDSKFGPRYHHAADGHSAVDHALGTCDTTHPLNFGAASGPCANHFPIILVDGEVEIKDAPYDVTPLDESTWEEWYMQGVVILDTLSTGVGSEFELESPGTLAGIIIGKGCIQLQDGSQTYGALFMDGQIQSPSCEASDRPLEMDKGDHPDYRHTDLYYSGCVVQEVLSATGLGEAAGAGGAGVQRVSLRSFSELLR